MRVFLDTIGCRLNQGEIEKMAGSLLQDGHEIVAHPSLAEIAIVNTCVVTSAAVSDSRQKIRQIQRAGVQKIYVTGCLATLQEAETAALPGVVEVVDNEKKDQLINSLAGSHPIPSVSHHAVEGKRFRTRAFIKAQDGCDNFCTFCLTRLVRGPARSIPSGAILEEIRAVAQNGGKEAVLCGVNLSSWQEGEHKLDRLVRRILEETDIPRLSLSSLEPWGIDEDLIACFEDGRLCRHLHVPLQSGSQNTLKRMGRQITPAQFASILQKVTRSYPDFSITTDVMAGFPGENEEEFEETVQFIQSQPFTGGHVFPFSPRPGTPALALGGRIAPVVAKERCRRLRAIFAQKSLEFREKMIGDTKVTLWETDEPTNDGLRQCSGLTGNYVRVHALSETARWNTFSTVRLTGLAGDGMTGEIILL